MTEYEKTKLTVVNQSRSAKKVRRLTPSQLGIPSGESGPMTENEVWEELVDAAQDILEGRDAAAAVRTEDGTVATGIELDVGRSYPVHPLELSVWKAYSESESPVVKGVVVGDRDGVEPCGRCRQVVTSFSGELSPEIRLVDTTTGEISECVLDGPDW